MEKKDSPHLLKFPVRRWAQLSEEQLIRVKSIQCEQNDEIITRMKIFLYLAGLKISDKGAEAVHDIVNTAEDNMDSVGKAIDTIEQFVEGDCIILEDAEHDDKGRVNMYMLSLNEFHAYIVSCTEFLQKDNSLLALPFERLKIGKRYYKMPDAFLINTTYQQYTNSQHYLERYWHIMTAIEKEIENLKERADELSIDDVPDALNPNVKNSLISQATEVQRGFLANILTPFITQGETRYTEKGKPYTFRREVAKFIAEDEHLAMLDMAHAPSWLFSLVYQQVQDNLKQFKVKFPDLFKESKADPKHDALVAELGTINIVIEKGGYPNAAAVYDENAVFIFKRLDMINEEARETRKAMEDSKRKHK